MEGATSNPFIHKELVDNKAPTHKPYELFETVPDEATRFTPEPKTSVIVPSKELPETVTLIAA